MHSIEQRLNRWILTLADRLHVEALHVTRNHTSHMVGVRRASITSAVATLRDEGLIETERGMITILDRRKMEEKACECYGIIKEAIETFAP
jgi:CRP-like cAMP-binding protein